MPTNQRNAYPFLVRLGLIDSTNRPRSRLAVDQLLVQQIPLPRTALGPVQQTISEGDPPPDRLATFPWHLDDMTVVSS